jgi:hypothetical protein
MLWPIEVILVRWYAGKMVEGQSGLTTKSLENRGD